MGSVVVIDVLSILLLLSDALSDVATFVSADTSSEGIATSGFIFLPFARGKLALMTPLFVPLLLALINASILLTAFDTLIDEFVLMNLMFGGLFDVAFFDDGDDDDSIVVIVVVAVVAEMVDVGEEDDASDVRFPVVSASMSTVILT